MITAGKKRNITRGLIALGLAATALLYFAVDPSTAGWMPKCVTKTLTGFDCPGCGSQRMIHDILNGDLAAAWGHNAFLLCMIPLILLYTLLEFMPERFPRMFRVLHSTVMIVGLGIAIVAWGVVRNLI